MMIGKNNCIRWLIVVTAISSSAHATTPTSKYSYPTLVALEIIRHMAHYQPGCETILRRILDAHDTHIEANVIQEVLVGVAQRLVMDAQASGVQLDSDIVELSRSLSMTKAPRESIYPPSPLEVIFTVDFLNDLLKSINNIPVNISTYANRILFEQAGRIINSGDNIPFDINVTARGDISYDILTGIWSINSLGSYLVSYQINYNTVAPLFISSLVLQQSTDGFAWNDIVGNIIDVPIVNAPAHAQALNTGIVNITTVPTFIRLQLQGGTINLITVGNNGNASAAALSIVQLHT